MDLDPGVWRDALGIDGSTAPALVLTVAERWGSTRAQAVLDRLTDARPTALPGLRLGALRGLPTLAAGVYAAARASEPVHIGGEIGVGLVVHLGSCGALQPGLRSGDVVVATSATIGEGVSPHYGGHGTASADAALAEAAEAALERRDRTVYPGRVVTTASMLSQSPRLVESWTSAGHLALDLETSAVLSAATFFGMRALVLLVVDAQLAEGDGVIELAQPHPTDDEPALVDTMVEVLVEVLA